MDIDIVIPSAIWINLLVPSSIFPDTAYDIAAHANKVKETPKIYRCFVGMYALFLFIKCINEKYAAIPANTVLGPILNGNGDKDGIHTYNTQDV